MYWGLTTENPPVAGALREHPRGQDPPRKGWDWSQCHYKAQALWSHPAPLRFRYGSLRSHYGSFTVPLRFLYGLLRPITPLLRHRAYTHRNPADWRNENTIKGGAAPVPKGECREPDVPPGRAKGRLGSGSKRAEASKQRPILPPSRVQGAQPPPGVQRVPLYPKTLEGGLGGTAVSATTGLSVRPLALARRLGSGSKRAKVKKQRPLRSPSRVQGAQPPPGVQGESPCTKKRWRVG